MDDGKIPSIDDSGEGMVGNVGKVAKLGEEIPFEEIILSLGLVGPCGQWDESGMRWIKIDDDIFTILFGITHWWAINIIICVTIRSSTRKIPSFICIIMMIYYNDDVSMWKIPKLVFMSEEGG